MKHIAITGSRSIKILPTEFIDYIKQHKKPFVLVHGGATGVDALGSILAKQFKVDCKVVRPKWNKGATQQEIKYSYLKRNNVIVDMCDEVWAFWDGKSKGTKYTIDYAQKTNKLKKVYKEVS